MRQAQIFSGSSHPQLVEGICDRLGQKPGNVQLTKFSNGETSVQIQTSIRDQDVYIVQSGSSHINDSVVELLIMISACKGGSSKTITAVMPYFPYCRQSKKKSHRGAITARMVANLLWVAGVTHVITIDLHASQMQGFFKCPVDNLIAEPQIAKWIRQNIPDWKKAVVVSKNPGGTKRVTSLADAMKLSFGIVTTDRRVYRGTHGLAEQYHAMGSSMILDQLVDGLVDAGPLVNGAVDGESVSSLEPVEKSGTSDSTTPNGEGSITPTLTRTSTMVRDARSHLYPEQSNGVNGLQPLPLLTETAPTPGATEFNGDELRRTRTEPANIAELDDEFTDERARDVTIGRLIHGHIVDEDQPSPAYSTYSTPGNRLRQVQSMGNFDGNVSGTGSSEDDAPDHMMSSFVSTTSSFHAQSMIGGAGDPGATSEEDEEEQLEVEGETMVTLVGNVKNKPVILLDDMIDKAGSWIAAAETVVKRGGAIRVYCIATHGLFGGNCLAELEQCDEIAKVVVTNSFPIPQEKQDTSTKLEIIDVSTLLAEAIRRNKFGESMSALYMHDTAL